MPDWAAITIGVVGGVGLGIGAGYILLVWYWSRDRTF